MSILANNIIWIKGQIILEILVLPFQCINEMSFFFCFFFKACGENVLGGQKQIFHYNLEGEINNYTHTNLQYIATDF